jgi:hypothetical protein
LTPSRVETTDIPGKLKAVLQENKMTRMTIDEDEERTTEEEGGTVAVGKSGHRRRGQRNTCSKDI